MNNRIKSRYLRVMLLSLLFLLTAGQAMADKVYFKNTDNWSKVYAYTYNSKTLGNWPGKEMTAVKGYADWYEIDADKAEKIIFNNNSNKQTGNLDFPSEPNNAFTWNGVGEPKGSWGSDAPQPVETTWTVVGNKAILNGSTDWDTNNTANDMAKGADGKYTLTVEKTNLAAGDYDYKVVKNHSYSDGEFPSGQNNNTLTISEAGDYTIVYTYDGASNLTATATKNAPVVDPKTGNLYIKVADGAYTAMTKNADGNFTWTGDINNDVVIKFRSKDNDDDNYHLHPSGSGDYWVNETNHSDNPAFGAGYNYLMKWGNGNYTITVPADYSSVSFTKNAGYIENGIPVYPIGVQSETELKKYDFVNNPAIYLQCKVLNAERVSPEWQMIKGDDGKYHLNGFAMRGTKCRDWNGTKDIEALAFVRIYDADGTHTAGSFKLDKSAYLTNGELYNATFDPETNTLSLTEDETAQGHMPFIALVGNEMKQAENYTTPRNSNTNSAWQEAWIQYDKSGNILTDREGNVMYSTMWPPKNPIYFTANIGGERLYSSEQMTFKVDNNFTAKTGAEWKEQLTGDEYTGLALDNNTNYVRYVVPDIWFVGQAKIWTGWGGQSTNNGGSSIAQWSNHANWGYMNNKNVGTPINAETTYGVSTVDGANGNFRFDNPTYFKTIEFFYNESDRNASQIYTTLAFGNAQIEAKSVKESDGSYTHGQYKPSVTIPSGNTIKSYIIRCYDAATGELVTLNDGIVAKSASEGENPTSADFKNFGEGLAEGKYFYEMEVVFSNSGVERTATVKSNPFIIHFPGVYTLEPVALQLVKDGDAYVTYNKNTENAPLFRATINENNELTAVAPVAESERTALFAKFESNTGFNWTDKVLVVAPVPAQFKLDAEKPNATLAITDYTLNTSLQVAKTKDGSMAYLDNTGKFTDKVYTAVMNYKETVEGEQTDKHSMAKPASALMMRPNPTAVDGVEVTVTPQGSIGTESTIDGMTVPANADYYTVSVEMPFGAANVTADASAPKYIAVMGDKTAELSQAGTVTFNNVDPLTFVKDIKVTAVYPDGNGNYLEANVGNPVSCNGETDGFKKNDLFTLSNFVPVFNKGQAGVMTLGYSKISNVYDQIADDNLYVQYLKTQAFLGEDNIEVLNTLILEDKMTISGYITVDGHSQTALRFNVDENIELTVGMPVSLKATPVYFVKVDESISVPGNGAAQAHALKANEATEPAYVALYGKEVVVEPTKGGIVTGVNDITVDGVKAYKVIENGQVIIVRGSERFNIMGQPVR